VDGWDSLPPIDETIGQMEPTIWTDSFQRDLAVHQPPHPFLGPLGHAVSADAPSGIVGGLIAPVAQRTPVRPELTHRPAAGTRRSVQRRSQPAIAWGAAEPMPADPTPAEAGPADPMPAEAEPAEAAGELGPGTGVETALPEPTAVPVRPANPDVRPLSSAGAIELPPLQLAAVPEPPGPEEAMPAREDAGPDNSAGAEEPTAEPAPLIGGAPQPSRRAPEPPTVQRRESNTPTASPPPIELARPRPSAPAGKAAGGTTALPGNPAAESPSSMPVQRTSPDPLQTDPLQAVSAEAPPQAVSTGAPSGAPSGPGEVAAASEVAYRGTLGTTPPLDGERAPTLPPPTRIGSLTSDGAPGVQRVPAQPAASPPPPGPTLQRTSRPLRKSGLGAPLPAVPQPASPPGPASWPSQVPPGHPLDERQATTPPPVAPAPVLAQRSVPPLLNEPGVVAPSQESDRSLGVAALEQPGEPSGEPQVETPTKRVAPVLAQRSIAAPVQPSEQAGQPRSEQAGEPPTETPTNRVAPVLAQRSLAGEIGRAQPESPDGELQRATAPPASAPALHRSPEPGPPRTQVQRLAEPALQREPEPHAPLLSVRASAPGARWKDQSSGKPQAGTERTESIPLELASQGVPDTGGVADRPILGIQPLPVSQLAAPPNPAEPQSLRAAPVGLTNGASRGRKETTTPPASPLAPTLIADRSTGHPPVFREPPTISRFADPASVALAAGIARAAPDGSIVFQPPAGEVVPPPEPAPAPSLPVQRAEDQAPSTPAVTASAAPTTPGAGTGSQDLDELARKLYPWIRPYLKKELWLDRERAGMLTGPGR
jgi:hypothetical protein